MKAPRNSPERVAELCEANTALVYHIVNRLKHIPHEHRDDAVAEAMLIMVKCARNYDDSLGWSFGTYAGNSIKLGLSENNWRRLFKIKGKTFNNNISEGYYNEESSLGVEYLFTELEAEDQLHSMLSTLDEREREILLAFQTMPVSEIREKFGITIQRIYQIKDRAIERLRRAFKEQGT